MMMIAPAVMFREALFAIGDGRTHVEHQAHGRAI